MRAVLHLANCDFERGGGNKWFVNECLELGRVFFSVELKSNKSLRF